MFISFNYYDTKPVFNYQSVLVVYCLSVWKWNLRAKFCRYLLYSLLPSFFEKVLNSASLPHLLHCYGLNSWLSLTSWCLRIVCLGAVSYSRIHGHSQRYGKFWRGNVLKKITLIQTCKRHNVNVMSVCFVKA